MCCCGAEQDLHPAPQGHARLAPGAAAAGGTRARCSSPVPDSPRRCRAARDPAPGPSRSPQPRLSTGAGGAASRLASFTTWQSWAPRCPPPWPPCARSAPRAAHTDKRGLRNPGSTRRGGEVGGAPGPPPRLPPPLSVPPPLSTSQHPGGHRRGSLPISQHPAPSGRWPLPARGPPAPFTVREETATGRRPP